MNYQWISDLSVFDEYDVILSSSSSCAKGVITKPGSIHVCYCHTPMRYAWEKREEYLKDMGKFKKIIVKIFLSNFFASSQYSSIKFSCLVLPHT